MVFVNVIVLNSSSSHTCRNVFTDTISASTFDYAASFLKTEDFSSCFLSENTFIEPVIKIISCFAHLKLLGTP